MNADSNLYNKFECRFVYEKYAYFQTDERRREKGGGVNIEFEYIIYNNCWLKCVYRFISVIYSICELFNAKYAN